MVQIKKNKLSKKNIRKYKNNRSKTIKLLKNGGNPEINIIVQYSFLDDIQEYTAVLHDTDTVLSLKKNIYNQLELKIEDQIILFNDIKIYDTETLSECGLVNGSIVYVKDISIPPHSLLVINVFIKDSDESFIFKVNRAITVYQLKEQLLDFFGIEIEDQRLTFQEKELDDRQYLFQLGLINNISTIVIEDTSIPNKNMMVIMIVNNNNGKKSIIKLHKMDTVLSLKKIIYDIFEIRIENQHLIFGNNELDDRQIVSECGLISNSSTVYVEDTSIE